MAAPGILPGGSAVFGRAGRGSTGVFADQPGATPKTAFNHGSRDAEHRESMARLFVEIPATSMEEFLNSLPQETQELGRVLAVHGTSSRGGGGTGFIDFLLTRSQESFQEKEQIIDTLTDNYVAFYAGAAPAQFSYMGTVLNTYQDDQRVWLLRLYRDILRGTRLARRGLVARLRYDSFIVSGYLTDMTLGLDGDVEVAGSFAFNMRVKHMTTFTQPYGKPTIVETAATSSLLQSDYLVSPGETERVATTAPETAPTAIMTPAASVTTEVDPRAVESSDEFMSNPDNVSNDGQGGQSNLLGTLIESSTTTVAVARRTSLRSRGRSRALPTMLRRGNP